MLTSVTFVGASQAAYRWGLVATQMSDEGTLVYAAGRRQDAGSLVWVDREGKTSPFGLPEGNYAGFALSPDDGRLAFGRDGDIWVYDTRLGTTDRASPRVIKGKPARNAYPCWTPDGRRIIYLSRQADTPARLVEAASDGSGEPVELWRSRGPGSTCRTMAGGS